MKDRKWISNLCLIWGITTIILMIGLLIQSLLPSILKKYDYLEMLLDINFDSLIILALSVCITIILVFIITNHSSLVEKIISELSKRKPIRIIITSISIVLCLLIVLIEVSSISSGVLNAKNVKTLHGKVSSVDSISQKSSGDIAKVVTIEDSEGKEQKFIANSKLEQLDTNKKDKIVIDYVPKKFTPSPNEKVADGMIMGYTSHS